jgi:outer membrane protein assembly factor BamB
MCRLLIIPVLLLPFGAALRGQESDFVPRPHDWPQWQGPDRNNHSKEKGLLQSWPKAGPPLAWKAVKLGGGYTAPSVAAGRIFGMSYRGNDEVVWCLAEKDGKELWNSRIADANRKVDYHEGSRCTPTVDGDLVYVIGVSGDLVCLRIGDGGIVWRKHFIKDFGGILPYYRAAYGFTESPLIDGSKVVVTPGGPKATFVALDKKTGDIIWKAVVPESKPAGSSRADYSSIILAELGGQKTYVNFLHGGVAGVHAETGAFLWRYDKPSSGFVNCLTPVAYDNQVFASSAYGKGAGLARIVPSKGKGALAEEVYFNKRMKNLHGGLVLKDGFIYGGSDPGLLVCMEFATGKGGWDERRAGRGAIAYADGHLYYRDERGPMLLIEANPKKYVEKGRFDPPDRSNKDAWSHPVIANGKLYLRDQDVLHCYDVRAK